MSIYSEFKRITDHIDDNLLESFFIIINKIIAKINKNNYFGIYFLRIDLLNINEHFNRINDMEDLFPYHEKIILQLIIN